MESHHEAGIRNHIAALSPTEKSNLNSHINAAGNDENHESAKKVAAYIAGIIGVGALGGYSWLAIKQILRKYL